MTALRRRLRLLRGERGFTLVELMTSAVLAAVGVGAITTVLVGARELVSDSERGSTAAQVAERELEEALAEPYADLSMSQPPATSTNPADPRYHVASSGSGWTYRWDQAQGSSATPAAVIYDPADPGDIPPSTTWDDGRMRGVVHRFVTVYDDPSIANTATNPLPDGKRVTVVVTVEGGTKPRKPVLVSSVVSP